MIMQSALEQDTGDQVISYLRPTVTIRMRSFHAVHTVYCAGGGNCYKMLRKQA